MKRIMYVGRSFTKQFVGLCIAIVLLASCKKSNDNYVRTPVAGIMAFNLAVDKPAVGFTLSGNYLGNTALAYTNYTGSYLPIYTGTRDLNAIDVNTSLTLASTTGNFADSGYYSTFLLGANGSYKNVLVEDKLLPLTVASGKAWVRYINAVPDSTVGLNVTVASNGESVISESAGYGHVSSFVQVNAGSVNTSISNGGSITANRAITLEENKVYTVLFVGLPNQTDQALGVQVKFIQNGIVTP